MNTMSRAIANVLSSLLCGCWIADAAAVGMLPPDSPPKETPNQVLIVHPALPTPSTPIVIEGRISAPFDIGDHCMSVFEATSDNKWVLSNVSLTKIATDNANYFTADLGTLDAGTYMFTYTDSDCRAQMYNEWSVEFSVSTSGTLTVVEYFNAALGHYFITADTGEIAKLDDGTIGGWTRTGETFHALPIETMPSTARPVCRYYGLPSAGLDTHFYSDNPVECAAVMELWPDKWVLETDHAFGVEEDWMYGDYFCEDSHRKLYRLYNNRADANHRYTTSPAIRDAMLANGWILESKYWSAYPEGFSMCVPQ